MDFLPQSITHLIDHLSRLPGLGAKSAQRLAFHLLKYPDERRLHLGQAILNLTDGVNTCQTCFALSTESPCKICSHPGRDTGVLCVVENTLDLLAIEKTGEFHGLYHVLEGKLSPLDGINSEDIRLEELFDRILRNADHNEAPLREVIVALNPDLEGDTTGLFIQRKLSSLASHIPVTRIARGIPSGGHLEYTDDTTLIRALEGRQRI